MLVPSSKTLPPQPSRFQEPWLRHLPVAASHDALVRDQLATVQMIIGINLQAHDTQKTSPAARFLVDFLCFFKKIFGDGMEVLLILGVVFGSVLVFVCMENRGAGEHLVKLQ